MATEVATKLLKFTAEKVAGAAAGKVLEKGLDFISGGGDTDKIQQSISNVLKEVQDIKMAVTNMSKKLDEGILRLRKDTLGNPLNDIETYYSSVQDCLNQAIADKKEILDQARLKDALTKLQTRLESKLKLAADTVPGHLGRVNDFLQDKDFLNAAATLAWQGSNDFIAYYMKMKVLFLAYWVVVVKGITLLEMAHVSLKANFDEAPQTIKRHTEMVKEQERAFSEVVGNNTCLLAEWLLAAPDSRRPITFLSGWGSGIECNMQPINAVRNFNVPQVRDSAVHHQYLFQVTAAVSNQNFDLSKSYPVRVYADKGNDCIIRSDTRLPIYMTDGGTKDSAWYIKPVSIGSDRYRFVSAEDRFENAVLVTGWNQNKLEWRQNLDPKNGLDGHPERGYFQVFPWTG